MKKVQNLRQLDEQNTMNTGASEEIEEESNSTLPSSETNKEC